MAYWSTCPDESRCACTRLLTKLDFPEMRFSLLFLGYQDEADIPKDAGDRVSLLSASTEGTRA